MKAYWTQEAVRNIEMGQRMNDNGHLENEAACYERAIACALLALVAAVKHLEEELSERLSSK